MADNDIMINILLDRSGSMGGHENDVINHYNAYIESQRNQPGLATVSLVLFDTEYEQVYLNKNINTVQPLDKATYFVRGGTAYLDALGRLIHAVDKQKNKPAKVIFVINTDGEENSSREFTLAKIKSLVQSRQTKKDWQFVFIGAGLDKTAVEHFSQASGFYGSSTMAAASADAGGIGQGYATLDWATTSYRGGSAATVNMSQATEDLEEEKKKKTTTPTTK